MGVGFSGGFSGAGKVDAPETIPEAVAAFCASQQVYTVLELMLKDAYPWFLSLDEVRREALMEITNVLGMDALRQCHFFLNQLSERKFAPAAAWLRGKVFIYEALDGRGDDVVYMVETGLRK